MGVTSGFYASRADASMVCLPGNPAYLSTLNCPDVPAAGQVERKSTRRARCIVIPAPLESEVRERGQAGIQGTSKR
jgi:hypothetical protein